MFTKELIDYTIKYFAEKYEQSISEEIAETYLNSFADLFASFSDLLSEHLDLMNKENSGTISR